VLGPRDRLVGQLFIEGDLHLGGSVEGEVSATGDVEIADEARVKASVAGGDVSVHGHVNGSVTARKRLVVGRSGSLIGDVRVARLVVQDGATFSGNVSMGPHVEMAPKPPEPVAEPIAEPAAPPIEVKASDGHQKATPPKGKDKGKKRLPR
jgi:cytoskeletal protein CcmA (bactofilin family)